MMLNRLPSQDDHNSKASTSPSSSTSLDSLHDEENPGFEDLATIEVIAETKATIYLVYSSKPKGYYALKAFQWENGQPDPYFLREVRFHKFHHPNLISIPHFVIDHEISNEDGTSSHMSFLIMEHAVYGDLFTALVQYKISFDDVLIRSYFHQLIDALEFLHSHGAAHLDVKLENLLLGKDFSLKLADFDLSYLPEDGTVKTTGTKNFRAPEILNKICEDPQAADIYSAGLILFLLKSGGNLPYLEENFNKEGDLAQLKDTNPELFWEKHCKLLDKDSDYFSPEFKDLFIMMTEYRPEKRGTISKIKESKWYNGPFYSGKELSEQMREKFDC